MTVERLATIFPADNLTAAIDLLTAVLGRTATFVDGDRWAQFDIGPTRVMLAGADERGRGSGVRSARTAYLGPPFRRIAVGDRPVRARCRITASVARITSRAVFHTLPYGCSIR
jgi:hypothetical protein